MPPKMTAFVFGIGVTAATVTIWVLSDYSIAKTGAILLAMLFGGIVYFLMNARR